MHASVTSQRHGPNGFIIEDGRNLLQRNGDYDARVLVDDGIIDASQVRSLRAILGFLDGLCHLPEQHVDANVVHSDLEPQDVLNRHRLDDLAIRLKK